MKAALIIVLAAAGCANILDIPDRHLASDSVCSGTIKVKILYDATGATSGVSVPFYKAQIDSIREANQNGGLRGCQIEYEAKDYGYVPANAQTIYDGWKAQPDWPDIVTIFGWGSSDSIQLASQVRDDKKPFLSASYIGDLAAPAPVVHDVQIPDLSATFQDISFPQHFTSDGFGYNFFAGTDYSTGARIAMFHVVAQGGKRVGFFYCSADYCTGPIPAAREYAQQQGLQLGRDLTLELTDTQATYNTKVMQYFMQEQMQVVADPSYKIVDWVWGGNTTTTTAYLAKAIGAMNKALGLNVQIVVNNWGFDETLFSMCNPDCVDHVHGIMPFIAYGDTSAGEMSKVIALHDKWRQIDAPMDGNVTYKNVRYIQGYVNFLLFKLAVDQVVNAGKPVNGDNIKAALEGLNGVDTGGLTGRLTFTPTDHRPQSTESVYKLNATGGLVIESQRTITLEDSWLGW